MKPFFKRFISSIRHENERKRWEEDFVDKFNETYSHVSPEGGILTVLINKTGAASVKGSVVTVSDTTDNAFRLEPSTSQFTAMGIVYDDGIADGSPCRVVVAGVAEVLLEDGTTSTREDAVIPSSVTSGRANAESPPVSSGTATQEHFKEIGHCLETKASGTGVLCKIIVHFN